MLTEAITTNYINTKLETGKDLKSGQDLDDVSLEKKPEGLVPRLQTYIQDNLSDLIIISILVSLTAVKFAMESQLTSLYFFFLIVFGAGYALGKRFAVLTAFLTILVVWAFILADYSAYAWQYNGDVLNFYMTLWGGFLVLTGWLGSAFAKTINGCPEETLQA